MTQDEIIRMAREAGLGIELAVSGSLPLERFANLVTEATKEKVINLIKHEDKEWLKGMGEAHDTALYLIACIGSLK